MTNKEALEILVKQANERKLSNKIVANGIAVSLLEKLVERDTPMKVIKEVDKKYVDTYDFYERDIYRCGSCKKVLLVDRYQKLQDNEKTNYCSHCGQRLDWSDI